VLEIEPGMPENQSLIFAVTILTHVSMLATLRDQMILARSSMQPAAQQRKTNFRQRAAAVCALFRVPPGRPTFAQRPNSPGSRPVRPYGQSGPVHLSYAFSRVSAIFIIQLNIITAAAGKSRMRTIKMIYFLEK
jgi:hypothetical protein